MARMEHGRGLSPGGRLIEEVRFDAGLAAAVVSERAPRCVLGRGHFHARTVHPDCSAMNQVIDATGKRIR